MLARVPLDVDLEDRLLYGLTPLRLAYAVGALLAAFALWSTPWGPGVLRGAVSSSVIGVGAIMSWGRWRGRSAEAWLVDLSVFVVRTHLLPWTGPRAPIRGPLASRRAS